MMPHTQSPRDSSTVGTNPSLQDPFTNTERAFHHLDSNRLMLALFVFWIMSHPFVAEVGQILLLVSLRLRLPVKFLLKRTLFRQFFGGEDLSECAHVLRSLAQGNVGVMLNYAVEAKQNEIEFERTLQQVLALISTLRSKRLAFAVIKPTSIARSELLEKLSNGESLTVAEKSEYEALWARLTRACDAAVKGGVRIHIDAEESWIQRGIDDLVLRLHEIYNREEVVVFNTVQMYRTDGLDILKNFISQSEQRGFKLGVKLVRGAYLEFENSRAAARGVASPIHGSKEATDLAFNAALEYCVSHLERVVLFAATHNETSTHLLTRLMHAHGVKPNDPRVIFAQLFGMSDHLTFNLAALGHNAVKFVPFGPVSEALPYLIRRAQENRSVLGQTRRDYALLQAERVRRQRKSFLAR